VQGGKQVVTRGGAVLAGGHMPGIRAEAQILVAAVLVGAPIGAQFPFPVPLTADVIDDDSVKTKLRRKPTYLGASRFVERTAVALAPPSRWCSCGCWRLRRSGRGSAGAFGPRRSSSRRRRRPFWPRRRSAGSYSRLVGLVATSGWPCIYKAKSGQIRITSFCILTRLEAEKGGQREHHRLDGQECGVVRRVVCAR
jgi:hypothetical protein